MSKSTIYHAISGKAMDSVPEGCITCGENAPSYLVGPGFFDPQVNGFAGVDFQDPNLTRDAFEHAAHTLRQHGCTHFLPTLITNEVGFFKDQFARMAGFIRQSQLLQDCVACFHLEGPFLSPEPGYIGAHPAEHTCPPDWHLFEQLQSAAEGNIKLITLAAELPGSAEFIHKARAASVMVSIGHSNASLDQLHEAVEAGAAMFTHLSNGCPAQMHRHDNIIQRVLSVPGLMVSLIPDGIHVPAPVLGNFTRALGPGRVVMITDAMSGAGAGPGLYPFAHLELEVGEDRIVRLPGTDQYAGSSLTPLQGFYNCIRFGGMDAASAWHAWTHLRTRLFPEINAPTIAVPFVGWHSGAVSFC